MLSLQSYSANACLCASVPLPWHVHVFCESTLVYVCLYTYMWRPEVNLGSCFSVATYFWFWRPRLPNYPLLTGQWTPSSAAPVPHHGCYRVPQCLSSLKWLLGVKLWFSRWQTLYQMSYLPSSDAVFWFKNLNFKFKIILNFKIIFEERLLSFSCFIFRAFKRFPHSLQYYQLLG